MPNTIMHLNAGGGTNRPTRIIIHAMAEYIKIDAKAALELEVRPGRYHAYHWLAIRRLSAHSLITPEGANIRARPDSLIAWHSKGHNTNTLGIEFLVPGEHDYSSFLKAMKTDYITGEAFDAGADQVRRWYNQHEIEHITTHHKIDPARKHDPGAGFPLIAFLEAIEGVIP